MRRIIYIPIFILMFSQCEEPTDIPVVDNRPRLVVLSNFSPSNLFVRLSRTQDIIDPQPVPEINDAFIELLTGESVLDTLILVQDSDNQLDGAYYLPDDTVFIQSGIEYGIRIEAPGFPSVSAKSRVPYPVLITEVQVHDPVVAVNPIDNDLVDISFTLSISLDDPVGMNYYQFIPLVPAKESGSDTTFFVVNTRDSDSSPSVFSNFDNNSILAEDDLFDNQTATFNLDCNLTLNKNQQLINQVIIETRTLSEEYFLYYKSLAAQQANGNDPFAEPVLLFNNIENGYGNFSAYTSISFWQFVQF